MPEHYPDLNELWLDTKVLDLKKNSVTGPLMTIPIEDQLCFLKLRAISSDGQQNSENFYWLHPSNDFTRLSQLNFSVVHGDMSVTENGDRYIYQVNLTNKGESLAFMLALSLQGKESGDEILPSLWSDNYLSLLPGESKTIYVEIDHADLHEEPVIQCKGFHSAAILIEL